MSVPEQCKFDQILKIFCKLIKTWPLDPTELCQTCFFGLLFYTVGIPKGFPNAVSSWRRWSSTNNEREQVGVTTHRGGDLAYRKSVHISIMSVSVNLLELWLDSASL